MHGLHDVSTCPHTTQVWTKDSVTVPSLIQGGGAQPLPLPHELSVRTRSFKKGNNFDIIDLTTQPTLILLQVFIFFMSMIYFDLSWSSSDDIITLLLTWIKQYKLRISSQISLLIFKIWHACTLFRSGSDATALAALSESDITN